MTQPIAHPKQPRVGVIQDNGLRRWEISIWLEDESNFCQVIVHRSGQIDFRPKEIIAAELVSAK